MAKEPILCPEFWMGWYCFTLVKLTEFLIQICNTGHIRQLMLSIIFIVWIIIVSLLERDMTLKMRGESVWNVSPMFNT